jgi:cephalosporin hydroxylase
MGGKDMTKRYGFFCGIGMQKSWSELFQLEALLNELRPDRIVELGAGSGGTTLFLAIYGRVNSIEVFSYDIGSDQPEQHMKDSVQDLLFDMEVRYQEVDIYQIQESIGNIIASDGRTLLYTDAGGSDNGKVNSLMAFAKYMKKGDIALVHDYGTREFPLEAVKTIEQMCNLSSFEPEWFKKFDAKHGAFIK